MKPTLKDRWNKLIETLKPMTPEKRLEHLWEYYKWVLVVVFLVVCVISIVVSAVQNAKTQVLISGVAVNLDIGADGYTYLAEDMFTILGGSGKYQTVEFTSSQIADINKTQQIEYTYNAIMRNIALVEGKMLDYMLVDTVGLSTYMSYDLFLDLGQVLTQEELTALEEDLIYLQYEETDERIPVAVNIRSTEFFQKHVGSDGPFYLTFIANTTRLEACRTLWENLVECE